MANAKSARRKQTAKPMTVPQLFTAMHKTAENARSLVQDAELLLEHQRYPRAFTLAEIALEELIKPTAYLWAASCVVREKPVDWQALDKHLRDHVSKIEVAWFADYLHTPHDDADAAIEAFVANLLNSKHSNDLKNYSLYAAVIDDQPKQPAEIIDAQLASAWVHRAQAQLKHVLPLVELCMAVVGTSGDRLQEILSDPDASAEFERLFAVQDKYAVGDKGSVQAPTPDTIRQFLADTGIHDTMIAYQTELEGLRRDDVRAKDTRPEPTVPPA